VDLIARDIRNPKEGTYVINEINTSPALLVHYEVQNQEKMRPVAKEILRTIFNSK
jgi:D-alanine-D-alanine ligase-like ATP-grasp enzyme